jgi:hypothetical protein
MPNEKSGQPFLFKNLPKERVIEGANQLFLQFGITIVRALNLQEQRDYSKEGIHVDKNENYQPISNLLQQGIERFRSEHPEVPVSWAQNPDHMSFSDIYSLLVQKLSSDDIKLLSSFTYNPEARKQLTLSTTYWEVILLSRKFQFRNDTLSEFLIKKLPGTAQERLKKAALHGEYLPVNRTQSASIVDQIEQKVEKTGKPCGLADVIPLALELTNGNLGAALAWLTTFYKQLARGSILNEKNVEQWFKKYIQDEFSPTLSFNDLKEGLEHKRRKISLFEKIAKGFTGENVSDIYSQNMNLNLTNQIGKPYHVIDMMSLLNTFSPELITFFVGGEYAQYAVSHGSNKLLADMLVLKELKKIQKYLGSISG